MQNADGCIVPACWQLNAESSSSTPIAHQLQLSTRAGQPNTGPGMINQLSLGRADNCVACFGKVDQKEYIGFDL